MTTKKKVTKKTTKEETEAIPIENMLKMICNDLEVLHELSNNPTVNMTDLLNLHNSSNLKIEQVGTQLEELKLSFNNNPKKSTKEIDNQTFSEYMNEINSLNAEIDPDANIEDLILSYKSSLQKINLCENYLKLKQMNLVYCDETKTDE